MRENPNEFQCSCFNKITAITYNIPPKSFKSLKYQNNAKTQETEGLLFPQNSTIVNPLNEQVSGGSNVPVEGAQCDGPASIF